LLSGLERNGFLQQYTHVLTGYMSSVSFLEETAALVEKMKKANPKLVFVCDPVLGDDGRLYVPKEFVPIYRERMVPLASVLTPNQTEASFLTELPINSLTDALLACLRLHARGVPTVIITSLVLQPDFIDVLATTADPAFLARWRSESEQRQCGGEGKCANGSEDSAALRKAIAEVAAGGEKPSEPLLTLHLRLPRLPTYYSGTGDLTSALLLAWLERDGSLVTALEKTMGSVAAVLDATAKAGREELALVQSRMCLVDPPLKFRASLALFDPAACCSAAR